MITSFLRGFLFMGLGLLWGGLAQAQCPPGMYPFQLRLTSPPLARLFRGMAISRRRSHQRSSGSVGGGRLPRVALLALQLTNRVNRKPRKWQ